MKRAEKLYLCGSEKASAGPRVPGGPSCSCPSLGEAKGQRAVVGQRRTNSCQSVRGLVLAGPFSTPVMLWLLMYPVHDVDTGSRWPRQAPRQEERATLRTQCVFAFLFRSDALRSSRIAKPCRSNLTLGLLCLLRQHGMTDEFASRDRFHISTSDQRFCPLLSPSLQNLASEFINNFFTMEIKFFVDYSRIVAR